MRTPRLCSIIVLLAAGCTSTHVIDDTQATTVGPDGGEATSADGALTLTFAEGALDSATDITVGVRHDVVRAGLVSAVYELGPSGLEFGAAVEVTLDVGDLGATRRIVLANADGDAPVPVQGSTYYPADGVLRAELRHFSSYGGFEIDDATGECFEPVFAPEHPNFSRYEGAGEPNACASDGDCATGGCSDEVCSANPEAITTCEIAPPPPGGSCLCVAGACRWARACEGELGACARDRDCDDGYACVDGACRAVDGVDADGDGFTALRDCDDHDPLVFPWAPEMCDGRDNDCNGIVDEGCGEGCSDDTTCPRCHVCIGDGMCVAGECPDPGPVPCAYNEDCHPGETCHDGLCRPDLGDRPHCPEGRCEGDALTCYRPDGTTDTHDCAGLGGHCAFVGPDLGFACVPGEPLPPCTAGSDCPPDAVCIEGHCRPSLCALPESDPNFSRYEGVGYANDCGRDSDCVVSGCGGEVCAAEDVFSTCEETGFGPGGTIPGLPGSMRCQCVHAQCQWLGECAPGCASHEECPWGSACREGTCVECPPVIDPPPCEGGELTEEFFGNGCYRPFCACPPGSWYDPSVGGCSGGCDATTGCTDGHRALCVETGGEWDPWACGDYDCGVGRICDAIIPGCNCGAGRVFNEFHGCVESPDCGCDDPAADGTCPRHDEDLCWGSGGSWDPNSCGHWVCGAAPMCDAIIPGCNCGDGRVFVPGVGCRRSDSCGCTDADGCNVDREVCWATGGDWDPYACGPYKCGEAPECMGMDASTGIMAGPGGCNCGPERVYYPDQGCVRSEECYSCDAAGNCCMSVDGTCPPPDDISLCTNSGGTWYDHGCGNFICGESLPECFADQPGCDCGPYANFVEGWGCTYDESCACADTVGGDCMPTSERLCWGTGGSWYTAVCGNFICGESLPECFVAQDGCDCGPYANFQEGEGCVYDPGCGCTDASGVDCTSDDAHLCSASGGTWHIGGCGNYTCGESLMECFVAQDGCDCGFHANFVSGVGCKEDPACGDVACHPDEPFACPESMECIDGTCVQTCMMPDGASPGADPAGPTTAYCPEGFVCDGGLCVKACGCASDADCGVGSVCSDCACVEPVCTLASGTDRYARYEAPDANNACHTSADCLLTGCSGEVCAAESVITTCEAIAVPDMDCGCVSGECVWHHACAVTGTPE